MGKFRLVEKELQIKKKVNLMIQIVLETRRQSHILFRNSEVFVFIKWKFVRTDTRYTIAKCKHYKQLAVKRIRALLYLYYTNINSRLDVN